MRQLYFIVTFCFFSLTGNTQSLFLELDLSSLKDPHPDSVIFRLASNDHITCYTYAIGTKKENFTLRGLQPDHYQLRVYLTKDEEVLLEGFGRGFIPSKNSAFVKSYINTIADTSYLLVDWKNPEEKTAIEAKGLQMLDTAEMLLYPIQRPDSLADAWMQAGMPKYNYKDVKYSYLDSNLIPMISYGFGDHRNPVAVGLMTFAFYEDLLRTGDKSYETGFLNNASWFVENHDTNYYFHYGFSYNHAGRALEKGWVSGMAQGNALGAVSLAYYYTGDTVYLKTAEGIFKTLYSNAGEDWSVYIDENHYYWIEEYPNVDHCHVLNGKITALFGLWEYYVITRDALALKLFRAGVRSLADHWPVWNMTNRNKSYYCLHHSSYPGYHLKHLHQLRFFGEYFHVPELVEAAATYANHTFTVYPVSRLMSPDKGQTTFHIFNASEWTAENNLDWISLDSSEKHLLKVNYELNNNHTTRQGNISISYLTKTIDLDVSQEKANQYIITVPDTLRFPSEAGDTIIPVMANVPWIPETQYNWLNLSADNDTTLQIEYAANDEMQPRTATIDINFFLPGFGPRIILIQEASSSKASIHRQDEMFKIYPNPVSEQFFIFSSFPESSYLKIMTADGRTVYTENLSPRCETAIETGTLLPGIYLVKILANNQLIYKNLIIKK